jgi:hypothetical protein
MAEPQPAAGRAIPAAIEEEDGTVKPNRGVRGEYLEAFSQIVGRVAATLAKSPAESLPVRMYVAGGAALYLVTGVRVSEDIDATFSRRLVLGEDIEVSYRDPDGGARLLYLDRNYNDTLGLLHQDAYADSLPVRIPGIDAARIQVRILSPLDLALTKIARFSEQDRADIELLAREGLIDAKALRRRAEEALQGYVGALDSVRTSIALACRLVEAAAQPRRKR